MKKQDAISKFYKLRNKTYAELDTARKNLRSHRKKALDDLAFWVVNNIK